MISCSIPAIKTAASYAYMSRNHPRAFRVASGVSVRSTNVAHNGAAFRRSSTVKQEGAFPVRGKDKPFCRAGWSFGTASKPTSPKYSLTTRNMLGSFSPMY